MKSKMLKPRQLNAIQLLAMGTPITQVAMRLEVSTMTIYRWQQQKEFKTKVKTITSSDLEAIAKKMNIASLTAIEILQELMYDMRVPINTQIKVCLGVLRSMASFNGALKKSLQHKTEDFDLQKRVDGQSFTFDRNGDPFQDSDLETEYMDCISVDNEHSPQGQM